MLKKVKQHIAKHQLLDANDHILLTLSGGADSMALLKILTDLDYKLGVAHCNFNLRGAESDADEQFVRDWLEKLHIPAHFISFDTRKHAKENNISIEMAARELRYNWFGELCQQHGYNKIATGHHLNDSIETVFLNLTRGTGIHGITGIQAKNGNELPLLTLNRSEIEDFLTLQNILYRHDSSNNSLEYLRNVVRHQIVPAFVKMNPAFENVMAQNLENLNQVQGIYQNSIDSIRKEITQRIAQGFIIDIQKLRMQPYKETILFELVKDYGFSLDTVQKAVLALDAEPGRIFYSNKFQLLIDRDTLLVERQKESCETIVIHSIQEFDTLPFIQNFQQISGSDYELIKSAQTGSFDLSKLNFPITFRTWQSGDKFYPLGMQQTKKLSDFFTDLKIDRFQKEKIRIMESDGAIVWIMGYRIDNRFKVTKNTQHVLVLKYQH